MVQQQLMPIARTPMDKKSGKALVNYYKDVTRMIDRLTPWKKHEKYERRRRQLARMGVKPGEIVVIGGAGDSNNPLYKDAKMV